MDTRSLRLVVAAAAAAVAGAVAPQALGAVSGTIANGTLAVSSDAAGDTINVTCFNGSPVVSDASVAVTLQGLPATCDDITTVTVDAGGGDDLVSTNDVATGFPNVAAVTVHGGDGADQLSGAGNQTLVGDAGADKFVVNLSRPGATTVVQASLADADQVVALGTGGADRLVVDAAGIVRRTDPADATLAAALLQITNLAPTLAFGEPSITLSGQLGDDVLDGSAWAGPVAYEGGGGSNNVTGGPGADRSRTFPGGTDTVDLGGGADRYAAYFGWNPGAAPHVTVADTGGAGEDTVEAWASNSTATTLVAHPADVTADGIQVASFTGIEAVNLIGGPGADVLDTGTANLPMQLDGRSGGDESIVRRLVPTTVVSDTFSTGGSDTLRLLGTAVPDDVTITGNAISTSTSQAPSVLYSNIETVRLDLLGGGDTYRPQFGGTFSPNLGNVQIDDTGPAGDVDTLSFPCLTGAVAGAGTIAVGTQTVGWTGIEQAPDCTTIDLRLAAVTDAGAAAVGEQFVYTAVVDAQRAAATAQLDVNLAGAGVAVDAVRSNRGACTTGATVHCDLGTIDGVTSAVVKIIAHGTSAGRVAVAGTVTPGAGVDAVPANDTGTLNVDVAGKAGAAPMSQISFATGRDGDLEIFGSMLDGSALRNLTRLPTDESEPSWTTDGSKLAFVVTNAVNASDIWVMNADGTGLMQVTQTGSASSPSWSPNGLRLAFVQADMSGPNVDVMDANGGNVMQLTTDGESFDPFWAADGRIVFSSGGDLWSIAADGSGKTALTQTPSRWEASPAVSPDGTTIAFAATDAGGPAQIWTMRSDGTGATRLVSSSSFDTDPAWSPDGSQLAFSAYDANGGGAVRLVRPDGTGLTTLAVGDAFEPAWLGRGVVAAPPSSGTTTTPAPSGGGGGGAGGGGGGGGGGVLPAIPSGAVAATVVAGSPGAVALDTTPPGSSTASHVSVAWPAAALPAGARVEVLPVAAPGSVPGFTAGGPAVDITVRGPDGKLITSFDTPLELVFTNIPAGAAVGMSSDGNTWELLPEIPGPPLRAGQRAAFYRDSSGNVHALVLHLTRFAVLPKTPEAKLALTVRLPARIDLRVVRTLPVWASPTRGGRVTVALANGAGRVFARTARDVAAGATSKLVVRIPRTVRRGSYTVRISVAAGSETVTARRSVVILGPRR